MRRFAAFVMGLVAVLSLLVGAAAVIGSVQPLPERLERLHLTDCTPPCWNGITPKVSSRDQVEARMHSSFPLLRQLHSQNLPFVTWISDSAATADMAVDFAVDDGVVYSTGIATDSPFRQMPRLGDVLALFGAPTCMLIDDGTGFSTLYYENAARQIVLQFSTYRPSLLSPVNNFSIGVVNNMTCKKSYVITWTEFRTARHSFRFTS